MKELGRESGDLAAALAVAFVCAACSSTPTAKPDQHAIEQFVSNGYQPPRHDTVRSAAIDWIEADSSWHFELLVPERVDRAPLVVYLPGLGQDEQAGERWTRAWAQAGYAVMSIQPLTEDQQAWSSDNARSGNFDAVARQGFSDAAMKRRLEALNSALVQLGRRAAAGDPVLHSVDLSRVAVAGFDLGAYSAMVIAGQQLEATGRPALSTPVRAVIALSPFADASVAANDQRFSAILGPVLNITGTQDVDAYGLIESAGLRAQPFQLMPPGDKYLVSLALGSHGLIGGADPTPLSAQLPEVRRAQRPDRGDEPSPDRRGHKRQSSAAADPDPSAQPDDAAGAQAGGQTRASRSELLTRQALSSASVRIVTTAFLDAYLRGDPAARSWLNQRARQWLTPNASLAIR